MAFWLCAVGARGPPPPGMPAPAGRSGPPIERVPKFSPVPACCSRQEEDHARERRGVGGVEGAEPFAGKEPATPTARSFDPLHELEEVLLVVEDSALLGLLVRLRPRGPPNALGPAPLAGDSKE